MTLSRRDRAAMTLSLHWLRAQWGAHRAWLADPSFSLSMAIDALNLGGGHCDDTLDTLPVLNRSDSPRAPGGVYAFRVPERLLRARLALYLRAVLRADAGDFGSTIQCVACGSYFVGWAPNHRDWYGPRYEGPTATVCSGALTRVYTPLWEKAPATKAGR